MTTFNPYYREQNWDTYFHNVNHHDPLRLRAVEAWVTVVMDTTVFALGPYIDDMLSAERQGYDDIHHKLREEAAPS